MNITIERKQFLIRGNKLPDKISVTKKAQPKFKNMFDLVFKKATFWPSLSFRKISSKVHQYLKILKPHYPWIYFNLVRKKLTFCSFGFTTLNSNSSVLMKFIDNSSLITQYKLITTKLKRILLEDIFNRDMFTVILNDIYDLKRKAVFSISKWQVFELSWVS